MGNKIEQARVIVLSKGPNHQAIRMVATKSRMGENDGVNNYNFDLGTSYTILSITPSQEQKNDPLYFPIKAGLTYTVKQLKDSLSDLWNVYVTDNSARYTHDIVNDSPSWIFNTGVWYDGALWDDKAIWP